MVDVAASTAPRERGENGEGSVDSSESESMLAPRLGRLEQGVVWTFSVVIWTAFATLLGAFILHRPPPAPPASTPLWNLVCNAGAAVFGAIFTLALIALDPDRPPPASAEPEAEA